MPETAPSPSLTGLAACLAVLADEAKALRRPLAAHLIIAAAAALQDAPAAPAPQETTRPGSNPA